METKNTGNQNYILEVCANSIKSAILAEQGGADRIELCSNISLGGTTPSIGMIKEVKEKVKIDVFVLIRPREGNFVYSDLEFEIIKRDIEECGRLNCQGVVSGVLTRSGKIDKERNKTVVELAKNYGMEITFHRALDRTEDIIESTKEIIDLGFDRILTSGGYQTVSRGVNNILELNKLYRGLINIMPGGGITSENILEIAKKTQAKEFHGTFSTKIEDCYNYNNPNMNENFYLQETDIRKIEEARKQLDKIKY